MLLVCISLLAFATAFYVLFEKHLVRGDGEEHQFNVLFMQSGGGSGRGSLFICIHMMLGEFADQLAFFTNGTSTPYPNVALGVFVAFMFIVNIVNMNLLIAIMGHSYAKVIGDGVVDDWRFEQAGVVLDVEAGMTDAELQRPEYFPKWVHVLEAAKVKPDPDAEDWKWFKYKEMLEDVKGLLEYSQTKQEDILHLLQSNIKIVRSETAHIQDALHCPTKNGKTSFAKVRPPPPSPPLARMHVPSSS